MHVYLPEKYRSPFLHGVFLFSKVWVSDSKLWWLFRSCLLESYLVILTSRRVQFQHTSLPTNLQLRPTFSIFLEGELWSQPYVFWWIATQFDHVSKCSIWVFLGDEAMWKKIWLFTSSCFHEEFLEFLSYSEKSFWWLFKTNLFWKIQAILMDKFARLLKIFVLL